MKIIDRKISIEELNKMAAAGFGEMVKGVVDIDRKLLALDAELHSDLEALLLQDGSKQASLWGVNLYPQVQGKHFIEYDSMINVRPSAGNRSRGIENESIRNKVVGVVLKWVQR